MVHLSISREMIYPSSPTLAHNKSVFLSLFDQIIVGCYSPILLFYQYDSNNGTDIAKRSSLLKKALSETLVDFYPLAGRIQRNELIDCSDQGAEFCEAHLSGTLLQYISNPSLEELQALLPFQELYPFQGKPPRHENIVLSVRVNHFSCGGMVVPTYLSHKIGDGAALADFIKAWASKAQDAHIPCPKFNGAVLFPPLKELNDETALLDGQIEYRFAKKRMAMRRLIFDKQRIDKLKVQAITSGSIIYSPTRYEAVIAFIAKHWPRKLSAIVQIVNLRKRIIPYVPDDFFGNCAWFTRISPITTPIENPGLIIHDFRKAIKRVSDNNYLKEIMVTDNFVFKLKKEIDALFEDPEELILSNSVVGYDWYEADFGMGKPIWACIPNTLDNNSTLSMTTKCGNGLEVWIKMHEDDLAKLDYSLSILGYPMVKPMNMINS